MIPGVNPRQLKAMMKQMGMSQDEILATEVIIKTQDGKSYVFENPDVQKVSMQGSVSFQITGNYRVKEGINALKKETFEITISEEDIALVVQQAGVSKNEARMALEKTKGDIAEAIIQLQN